MTKIIENIEQSAGHKYHLESCDHILVESYYEYYLRLGFEMDADSIMELDTNSRMYIEEGNIINNGQLINYGQIFNSI